MQEVYRGKAFSLYAQVELGDAEDPYAYPQWETGDEDCILGPKGVVVATAPDTEVDIIVYRGRGDPGGRLCISGEIQVGSQGLSVGNEIARTVAQIAWPAGRTFVAVYVNGPRDTVNRVMFVLEGLDSA